MHNIMNLASKLRTRTMAWQRNPVFKWYLIHTDHMSNILPAYVLSRFPTWFGTFALSFGISTADKIPNGPNKTKRAVTNGTN